MDSWAATIRRYAERREKEIQSHLDDLYSHACTDAQAIISMIVECFDPERVVQWGSLLDRRRFRDYSDIDIAIGGITDAATYFELYGRADELTNFPVDLVQLETIAPEYRDLILQNGRIVYEREARD
jgi:predicted nucleotidyltransferase